jgi:hypothetical protein
MGNEKSEYKIIYAHLTLKQLSYQELLVMAASLNAYLTCNKLEGDFKKFSKLIKSQLKDEDIRLAMMEEREEK